MAQPRWITPAGNLGTIAEGLFFSIPLVAVDPDAGTVYYQLIAGDLPAGVQIKDNGELVGTPQAKVQGVPNEVGYDVTSKFAIRAFVTSSGANRIADRTFSITVTGQDIPEFITPAGSLGEFYDGGPAEVQIEFTDNDPDDTITVSISSGELPPGLSIDNTGLISGVIEPIPPLPETAVVGYDASPFSHYPFDFPSRSINKNYQFTVKISDGKSQNLRTFDMFIISRNSLTADTMDFTADDTYITADEMPYRTPYMKNYPTDGFIGTYRNSNFFAYQFVGEDLDGVPVAYYLDTGDSLDLPPNLTFDGSTGWLYGYLSDLGATDLTYSFTVYVYSTENPSLISIAYNYSIEIIGNIENEVIWLNTSVTTTTDGSINLGDINNGDVSLFQILARNTTGRQLQFRLKPGAYPDLPGVYNKLPQGLTLLSSGVISGQVSFDTFALDGGTTTFDRERTTRLIADETTFDMVKRFTVEAYSIDGLVSVFQDFSIRVVRVFNEPFNTLYIKAMPPLADRSLLNALVLNQDIMNPDLIFRADDPYFGVQTTINYVHMYAINATLLENYVAAMDLNHFWKELTLGEIKVAQAIDIYGNVVYDVVYSEIVDTGVNSAGESPPQSVPVPYPFIDIINGDSTEITEVYPNSLIEMRDQMVAQIGQHPEILPMWMRSKQTDGRVLGFTKCWVIAYANPGKGRQLAYNIRTQYGMQLNKIDFKADRYTLGRQMSKNWIPFADSTEAGEWYPVTSTTFDYIPYYSLTSNFDGGSYAVGDLIKIPGNQLGGLDGDNDLNMIVTEVNNVGQVISVNYYGTVSRFVEVNTEFNAVNAVTVTGVGSGATFDVIVLKTDGATTFDGNSLLFNTPADKYGLTDEYNKYLLFPKTNILG